MASLLKVGDTALWTLSKAAGQPCEHLLWWQPVSSCCCLELRNAFFTLSGSRAKAIYRRSARSGMQLEVFGSSLNSVDEGFQTCPQRVSAVSHPELAGALRGSMCGHCILSSPTHTEALFLSASEKDGGAFIRNYEVIKRDYFC